MSQFIRVRYEAKILIWYSKVKITRNWLCVVLCDRSSTARCWGSFQGTSFRPCCCDSPSNKRQAYPAEHVLLVEWSPCYSSSQWLLRRRWFCPLHGIYTFPCSIHIPHYTRRVECELSMELYHHGECCVHFTFEVRDKFRTSLIWSQNHSNLEQNDYVIVDTKNRWNNSMYEASSK